ncbi:MAG: Cof-type HAD-IIB family hydrolase [Clostridia bacterium]|nr:Cof-type HAD-IIB family hydrolase [Clostridia bacterium]
MKKFEGLLFCTDLDGTLLGSDRSISKENLDAIEYFKSEGGRFTVVTGRPPQTAGSIVAAVRPNAPYGCLNGGGIYDAEKEKYLWSAKLDPAFLEILAAVRKAFPTVSLQANTEKNIYFENDNEAQVAFRRLTGLPNTLRRAEEIEEPTLKVIFVHPEDAMLRALADFLARHPLSPRFDFVRSEQTFYEILPKGVCKGAVAERIASMLDVPLTRVVAVGDYDNDVSMLRAAGLSFAVKNATPAAKAAARFETVSCDEHAIAAVVARLDEGLR